MKESKLRCINTWNELLEITTSLREKGETITNFYPNESEMIEWIENKTFFFSKLNDKSSCFVHKTEVASFLFFCIKDITDLSEALVTAKKNIPNETLAFDWICRSEAEGDLLYKQCELGQFNLHTSLQRMSQVLKENPFEDTDEIKFANKEDIDDLRKMFCSAFDPISERIPSKVQLSQYIESKSILIKRAQNEIAGVAVIDIQKKTMYLKHLLTNPKFRRQGVADSLLKKSFFLSKGSIRYILWVIKENQPAINLYKKFGYEFESLSNYTFVSN